MSSLTSEKEHFVRKRFKDHDEILMVLVKTDPEFQELCEEYELCMKATDYWSGQEGLGAQEKAKEFRSIADDLETEIAMKLAEFKP